LPPFPGDSTPCLIDTGIVNGDNLRKLVAGQISGAIDQNHLVSAWLTLEEWLRQFQ
jgi:hypothetical protein